MNPRLLLRLLPAFSIALAGCGRQTDTAATQPTPTVLHAELASGRIRVDLKAEPVPVRLDRPLEITLTLSSPVTLAADWPSLDDRFEGFTLTGAFDQSDPAPPEGRTVRSRHLRLWPTPAPEHRLKPLAIAYTETGRTDAATGWIRTRPLVFPTETLRPADSPAPPAAPIPIRLSLRTVLRRLPLYIGLLLAVLLFLYGAALLARRLIRLYRLRRMSPRQRALLELDALTQRGLIAAGRLKEFYFELTDIIRRYIERRHGIRAPEQTTEEFLAAAGADPRFPHDTLAQLKAFLIAADYVKFADSRPGPETGAHALQTARNYIESEPATPAEGGA